MSTDAEDEFQFESKTDTTTSSEVVLESSDLAVSYGKVTALRGLDITVTEGEIVSLIGPNGAGKTTFCNTASGFLDYDGSVRYRGQEVSDVGQTGLVEQGMIHCTEERDLFGYMDVENNLELGGYLLDDDVIEERKEFVYDLFPRLDERREQNARSMSGGEQQMLAIGRALMGDPDLLVLDEPTLGLAPVILKDIAEALDPIVDRGVTILLTEQNVTFALEHADRIYLLENGEAVREGTPEELKGDDYIRESYLGG
ncbi:ABC transporter ATP-binding protein [Natronomonas marina]|jgi:branched-chain amino acid transport system ATP-binding protein|uniref:ABC transporter ATP-binding protein n=1 Tax=Natronomonas marina TaxID=2961939 RepID=UPI0020C9E0B7|nr:ABC transporter ATP-binding protein [Natronomonas marina]